MAHRDRYSYTARKKARGSAACGFHLACYFAFGLFAGSQSLGNDVALASPKEGISLPGRVVDVETGKPIVGASIIVERLLLGLPPSLIPAWAGGSTLTTDHDGRFVLGFPAEQLAERRLSILLRVTHPGYISRKIANAVAVVEILLGRNGGDPAFFETIKLARGVEYTGQIVTPNGDPAAGATFELAQWGADPNPSDQFGDDTAGTTDSDGRFRVRAPKTHQLALFVTPADHSPFQHFWGIDEPDKQPDLWAPSDLGRLVLEPGIRLSGRLLDVNGRPVAGQMITAQSIYGRHQRIATTKPDGRFTFAPLRQGNYMLVGQGQSFGGGLDASARTLPAQGTIFPPMKVYLKDGVFSGPITLRELPTVMIETQFVDSRERPARGNFVWLWGQLPAPANQPAVQEAVFDGDGLSATINGPEREDKNAQLGWSTQLMADAAGRLNLRAPRGLQNVQLFSIPPNETITIRNRLGAGKPLSFWGGGTIENLKNDIKGVTFVLYDAPMILATVKTEDGERPVVNVQINANFTSEGTDYAVSFVEQADDRYRSQYLMPGQDYEVSAWATGFVPNRVHRVKLAEGALAKLELTIKRGRAPLKTGDFAPPFLVKTLAGDALALTDLKGKVVLLHFWNPVDDNCLPDLAHLKAVRARFANDDRLAMIGFCVVADSASVTRVVKEKAVSWPQVMLRDRTADSIVLDYDAGELPKFFLISPEGKLVARDLAGTDVQAAVTRALERK